VNLERNLDSASVTFSLISPFLIHFELRDDSTLASLASSDRNPLPSLARAECGGSLFLVSWKEQETKKTRMVGRLYAGFWGGPPCHCEVDS